MLATTAAMSEQFNKNNILLLEELGFEVHVAGNWYVGNPISNERLEQFKVWLGRHHAKWIHISATRNPGDLKKNINAYRQVVKLIKAYHYEFIHCHTPVGSVLARIAAHFTNTKIIYTAHGFHFYEGAPILNWLIYYPVEKFLSRWTDILVLINKEDYVRAKRNFFAKRTEYVPGVGIDLKKFSSYTVDREKKREELGVKSGDFLMLSVGELIPRKNHSLVIQGISQLKNPRIKYFICGKGELESQLINMIKTSKVENQVCLLGFREDIDELCQAADVFVLPSKQEGVSLALMEAMACKVPILCSAIRGNVDLINDSRWLFDPNEPVSFQKCLYNMWKCSKSEIQESISMNYSILSKYEINNVKERIKRLYCEILR